MAHLCCPTIPCPSRRTPWRRWLAGLLFITPCLYAQTSIQKARVAAHKAAINKLLWHAAAGLFMDDDFVSQQASACHYVATFSPPWAGLAKPEQAAVLAKDVRLLEHEGRLAMRDDVSDTQWDLPFDCAPTDWFAVASPERYGFHEHALPLASKFETKVRDNYILDGTFREGYNRVSGTVNVEVAAGNKSNVIGFGWTDAKYIRPEQLLPAASGASVSLPVTPGPTLVLTHQELEKLVPATVFFRGQTATVQLRNSAGLRYGDGAVMFAVKVDTGGYANNIQERYQDYLVTEQPLQIGNAPVAAGAYGMGFVEGKLIIMDLGGQQILSIDASVDRALKRPMPLQMVMDARGEARLYSGRSYVTITRVIR